MPVKETKKSVRAPNFIEALIPIVVMMALMIYGIQVDVYVDAHMPLIVSIVVACIAGTLCGHSFSDMLAGMLDRLNATMEAILILSCWRWPTAARWSAAAAWRPSSAV